MRLKKIVFFSLLSWLILVLFSFFWNYTNAEKEQENIAMMAAKSFFDHIVITRLWNAGHGGLYAPVTDRTRPNEYLETPLRDIKINDQLTLTKINPAFMTRQISEIALQQDGVQFHITSLNPLRKQNQPTPREKIILEKFEQGLKETGMEIKENGKSSYFYMARLITEKSCLSCHVKQGYKEGDIRGGISVTLPFVSNFSINSLLFWHLIIFLVGMSGLFFASSQLNKAYETIKTQAIIDALTGVPNRRSFSESILTECKRSKRQNQPLSIIMCDVDNFKAYNDTYGHANGDDCLKTVAQTVKTSLKRPGDFCARYGGEEFVVLLPNTHQRGALRVAERIRTNVEQLAIPHVHSPPLQVVTLSLGITTSVGEDIVSHEELVRNADKALYDAKAKGRNQVQSYIEPSLSKETKDQLEQS